MRDKLIILALVAAHAICSTMGNTQVLQAENSWSKSLELIKHEFLDVYLPSFVAQGYSRRELLAPGPAKNDKGKGKKKEGKKKGPPKPKKEGKKKGPPKPKSSPKPGPIQTRPAPGVKEVTYVASMFPAPKVPSVFKGKIIKIGYEPTNNIVVPAGANDTTQLFNNALADIAKAKGGELHIGPGTFILKYQFVIQSSNTLVKGAGMDKTVLKLADYAPGPWEGAGFLRWINEDNVTVTDLTLDGNKNKQYMGYKVGYGRYGIYMHGYKNALFLRVHTRNFQRYGFDPHGQKSRGAFIWSYGLTVINCVSTNNNWDGFTFDMTKGIYATGNFARGNGRHGFNIITGSMGAIVFNNTAVRSGLDIDPELAHGGLGCGFMTDNFDEEKHSNFPGGTKDILYFNNVVTGARVAGFCAKTVKNVTMAQNVVSGTNYCAFFLNNSTGNTFKKNRCIGTAGKILYKDVNPYSNYIYNNTFV